MLVKYLPILITGASFFIAIACHWAYKRLFVLPSLLAAICTGLVAFSCFSLVRLPTQGSLGVSTHAPWNAMVFALVSGLVLAMLVGYLMKYAPNVLGK
jgi:hypothetical protein